MWEESTMKNRWFALVLALTLLVAALGGAAVAEAENPLATPTAKVALGVGESWKIDVSSLLAPEGQVLQYKTSDKKIATVDADGVVTALKKGSATVAIGYDQTLLGLCKVAVVAAPKKVALSPKVVVLSAGDTKELSAKLSKDSASALTFASSNEAVATVDADGKITAVAGGKATITAQTFNDKAAECVVYVLGGKAPTTLSLNVSDVTIQVGETFQLTPSVDEGSDAYYKYASQNKKIARVGNDGVITGVKKGATTVAVKTHNGLTQTVQVTVKARLKDVYGCLTNDPKDFLKAAKKLKLSPDVDATDNATVVFSDDELALAMTAGSCQISLRAGSNPRYCVQGIDVSMTPQSAAAKLIAAGWAMTGSKSSDGVEQRAFTKGGDTTHYIVIATADGTAIQGITAQWAW